MGKGGGWLPQRTATDDEVPTGDLTDPGKVLTQTRSDDAFLSWLIPKRAKPQQRRSCQ